jgi:biotin carboxyl carrier protein
VSFKLKLGDTESEIGLIARRPHLVCTVDGTMHHVSEAEVPSEQCAYLTVDGRHYQIWRIVESDRIHLKVGKQTLSVGYEDPITAAAHEGLSADEVHADMPGVVVDLHCEQGMAVTAGDPLLTIESMKMQITVTAPRNGAVGALHVEANASFQKGALLVSLEPEAE